MLRVGLTGSLGSGKSTVAAMLARHGARTFSADEIARGLMQPGEPVFDAIVQHFGAEVLGPDGRLDRGALSRIAFGEGRVEELNAIVHPATIARQAELAAEVFARDPDGIVVIESALIFETRHAGDEGWQSRFDKLILVTAPDAVKIARYVERAGGGNADGLAAEARRRLAAQMRDTEKAPLCDYVVGNDGSLEELAREVDALWVELVAEAGK